MVAADALANRGFVGRFSTGKPVEAGGRVGTVDSGYRCRCGGTVFGDVERRRWARCVVCERVVDRELARERGVEMRVGETGVAGLV
jgi:hypothetical protein